MVNDARRRWMTVLLVVSLGFNLFFTSLLAGHWFAGPHGPRMFGQMRGQGAPPSRMIADRMAAALQEEHRAGFEAVMAKHRPTVAEAAAQFHASRDKVREAIAREPFDRAALEQAFAEQRARSDALQIAIQASIAEAAASLPPEARQRLADWRALTRRPR